MRHTTLKLALLSTLLLWGCDEAQTTEQVDFVDFDPIETIGEEPSDLDIIGEPIWVIDDLQIITSEAPRSANTPTEGLECVFAEEFHAFNPKALLFFPEPGKLAPFRTDFAAHFETCQVRSGTQLNASDVGTWPASEDPDAPVLQRQLDVIWTVLPRPGLAAFGSSLYFERERIIPASVFPLFIDVELSRQSAICESGALVDARGFLCKKSFNLTIPANSKLSDRSGNPIPGEGYSHLPMAAPSLEILGASGTILNGDVEVPAQRMLAGTYHLDISARDASGSGYDLTLEVEIQGTDCGAEGCSECPDASQRDCNGDPADGCEVNASEDLENCGGCGIVCQEDESCKSGACTPDSVATETRVELSLGAHHSCALIEREAWCWGSNETGQLGRSIPPEEQDGVFPFATSYARPIEGLALEQLEASYRHTCGLDDQGTVWCWGDNTQAQVNGQASSTPIIDPFPVSLAGPQSDVATGREHTCALALNGTITCWGSRSRCQRNPACNGPELGLETVSLEINGAGLPIDIEAGMHHTCVRTNLDRIFCWGDNTFQQSGTEALSPNLFELVPNIASFQELSGFDVNANTTCVTWHDPGAPELQLEVECRGEGINPQSPFRAVLNNSGQVFNPDSTPVLLAAGRHACAIVSPEPGASNIIQCWGKNEHGQLLGNNFEANPFGPSTLETSQFPSTVAVGGAHTCIFDPVEAHVLCRGLNTYNQTGRSFENSGSPEQPFFFSRARNIPATDDMDPNTQLWVVAGGDINCAPGQDGSNHICWGGTSTQSFENTGLKTELGESWDYFASAIPNIFPYLDSSRIALSPEVYCVLPDLGPLLCWGINEGANLRTEEPNPFPFFDDLVEISLLGTAFQSICIVHGSEGDVRCVGTAVGTPTSVANLELPANVTQLVSGQEHAAFCAITVDDELWCWGDNAQGQLGKDSFGDLLDTSSPVLIDVGAPVRQATFAQLPGQDTPVLCLLTDSEVLCVNQAEGTRSPVALGDIPDIESISTIAGGRFGLCLIIEPGGRVWCEEGPTMPRGLVLNEGDVPVERATTLAVGHDHACVSVDEGPIETIACWGSDAMGQLGQATGHSLDWSLVDSLQGALPEPIPPRDNGGPVEVQELYTCEQPLILDDLASVVHIGIFDDPECQTEFVAFASPRSPESGCCDSTEGEAISIHSPSCDPEAGIYTINVTQGAVCGESGDPPTTLTVTRECQPDPISNKYIRLMEGCDPIEPPVGEVQSPFVCEQPLEIWDFSQVVHLALFDDPGCTEAPVAIVALPVNSDGSSLGCCEPEAPPPPGESSVKFVSSSCDLNTHTYTAELYEGRCSESDSPPLTTVVHDAECRPVPDDPNIFEMLIAGCGLGSPPPLEIDPFLLTGRFERQPIENPTHGVEITFDEPTATLFWNNDAGESWTLIPVEEGGWVTGPDSPFPDELVTFAPPLEGLPVLSLEFMGETYERVD